MTQDVDLATIHRQLYRARFQADVEAGLAKPFLMPLHLLSLWIIPTLYLAIPHKNRPRLYQARWLVLAFITVFNFKMATEVSSMNFACAYGVGRHWLFGVWEF